MTKRKLLHIALPISTRFAGTAMQYSTKAINRSPGS
jgi:hypothetical protein